MIKCLSIDLYMAEEATMAKQITRATRPNALVAFGEANGLNRRDLQVVSELVVDYSTNLTTVQKLLNSDLTLVEVGYVFETRDRVNQQLESAEPEQKVSLKVVSAALIQFRSIPLDADGLTAFLLGVHERFQRNYLDHTIKNVLALASAQPETLPEALMDFMAGDSEFWPPEDGV